MREVFGRNMRLLRERMGWSINTMSEKTDIGVAMVSNYERGKSDPSLTILTKVANVFNLTIQDLIESSESEILSKLENQKNTKNTSSENIISNSRIGDGDINQGSGQISKVDSMNEVLLLKKEVELKDKEIEMLKESLKQKNEFIDTLNSLLQRK